MREFILAYNVVNKNSGTIVRLGDAWVGTDATTAKDILDKSRKFIADKEDIDPSWVYITSMCEVTHNAK